jgi:hypothetical protein
VTKLQSQLLAAEMLRTNLMFELWEKNKSDVILKYPDMEFNEAVLLLPSVNYLFIGIGFLDSVLEFMRTRSIPYPDSIKKDVKHIQHKLHKFRNAVFHINDKFLDQRQLDLMDFPNSMQSIVKIHTGIQAHFLQLIRDRKT